MKKGLRQQVSTLAYLDQIPTADLMKKGLRRRALTDLRRTIDSNSRPDEEWIKTQEPRDRRVKGHSNSRPDEEGIKTIADVDVADDHEIPTADLMKKGLRHVGSGGLPHLGHSNSRPDEEGIKTW